MYKLTIISGPKRGESFHVNDIGETSIGRQDGNEIVLQSQKISKRHCILVASNGELVLRDQGSSNGTFVNGVLSRQKLVKPGDKISVGEYVLEVVKSGRHLGGLQLVGPMDPLNLGGGHSSNQGHSAGFPGTGQEP